MFKKFTNDFGRDFQDELETSLDTLNTNTNVVKQDLNTEKTRLDGRITAIDEKVAPVADQIAQLESGSQDNEVILARGVYENLSAKLNAMDTGFLVLDQTFTATEGQTTFTINGTYLTGQRHLEVEVDNIPQHGHFTETSSTSFTINEPLKSGQVVYAKWFEGETEIPKRTGHRSGHEKGGYDEIDVTKLKNYEEIIASQLSETTTVVNVKKKHNAKGDGITNDTSAIQAAINQGIADGIPVYIPKGSYKITSQINIDGVVKIFGDGLNDTILVFEPTTLNQACFNFAKPTDSSVYEGDLIYGLTIDGVSQNAYSRKGIVLNGNRVKSTVKECRFTNLDRGLEMIGDMGVASFGNLISDCKFYNIQTYGINSEANAEQFGIIHCWFDYGNATTSTAIRINDATSGLIQNCVIQWYQDGIRIEGGKPIAIKDCHFEDMTRYNVYITTGVVYHSEVVSIEGCYMRHGYYGVAFKYNNDGRYVHNTSLFNNVFSDMTYGGIVNLDGTTNDVTKGLSIINCRWHYEDTTPPPLILDLKPDILISDTRKEFVVDMVTINESGFLMKPIDGFSYAFEHNGSTRYVMHKDGFYTNQSKGARLSAYGASGTNPAYGFNGDEDTGIGTDANGNVCIISNGVTVGKWVGNTLHLKTGSTIVYDL